MTDLPSNIKLRRNLSVNIIPNQISSNLEGLNHQNAGAGAAAAGEEKSRDGEGRKGEAEGQEGRDVRELREKPFMHQKPSLEKVSNLDSPSPCPTHPNAPQPSNRRKDKLADFSAKFKEIHTVDSQDSGEEEQEGAANELYANSRNNFGKFRIRVPKSNTIIPFSSIKECKKVQNCTIDAEFGKSVDRAVRSKYKLDWEHT